MTEAERGVPAPIRWLIEAGIEPSHGQGGAPPDTSSWPVATKGSKRGIAYVAGQLRNCAARIAAMPEDSGRNNALNTVAYVLARRSAAGWIDAIEVRDTLYDAGLRCGLPRAEVVRAIRSGMTDGLKLPEDPRLPPDRPVPTGDNPVDEYVAGLLAQLRPSREAELARIARTYGPRARDAGSAAGPDDPPEGSSGAGGGPGPPELPPGFATLPDEFWDARPELAHIRVAARSKSQSPDVVLHGVLSRIAALRDPNLRVESGIGPAASLNYYSLIIGPSGEGKTTGLFVAAELTPCPARITDFQGQQPLGSGEGIVEMYWGTEQVTVVNGAGKEVQRPVRRKVRDRALLYVDEGELLLRLNERVGATGGSILRSAWSGANIGFRNAREDTTRHCDAFSYSLGLIVGIQPHLAVKVLDDSDTGTPQRFVWACTDDPDPPATRIPWPGDLPWDPGVLTKWVRMDLPEGLKDQLWEERRARRSRQAPPLAPLDAHRPITLIKISGLLALLAGRVDVIDEDWSLAEIVWDTSCAVRDAVVELGRAKAAREAEDKRQRQIELQEVIASKKAAIPNKLTRIARGVALKIHENGIPFPRTEARHLINSRDRGFFDAAMEIAVAKGWLIASEHGYAPGESHPA